AQWTHAAVFLSDDQIVEAVPWHGVRTRSLYTEVPHRVLRFRRRQQLDDANRYQIAMRARAMLGSRYSFSEAIKLGGRAKLGMWDRWGAMAFGGVTICSTVFSDAYLDITRSLLEGVPVDRVATPAHLSATSDLVDINVYWMEVT